MSVAVQKVEGVESVRVSLEEGLGEIVLEPANSVDPEVFLEIVRDNGFTSGAAEIKVAGKLVARDGRRLIEVSGSTLVYELVEDDVSVPASIRPGREIVVRGRLAEPSSEAAARRRLWLLEFREKPVA